MAGGCASRPQCCDVEARVADRAEQSPGWTSDRHPCTVQSEGERSNCPWRPLTAAAAEEDDQRRTGKNADRDEDRDGGVAQIEWTVRNSRQQQCARDAVGEKPDPDKQAQQRPTTTEEL